MNELNFNPNPPTIMHLDLNSCFATIEQQANPHLRGKPVAVAAYTTPSGCIIAPSVEAKRLGIAVGMRVKDGKLLCPGLIVLLPDPWKYRNVHLALRKIVSSYTNDFSPKSIDEFVLNMESYLTLKAGPCKVVAQYNNDSSSLVHQAAWEIKQRIKKEVGEWLTVSIGIAPNRFLAKVAASLHKPDGLDEINKDNYLNLYSKLKLTDLPYIKARNAARLNTVGIFSVLDFYHSPIWRLKGAFESILGYFWYIRLHGYEIDNVEFGRRSYGNSYALPKPLVTSEELSPILSKLVEKMGFRLRRAGYTAQGVHVAIGYRDGSFWHKGSTLARELFDSREIYKKAYTILASSPYKKPVRELGVSCFKLKRSDLLQLELFEDTRKKKKMVEVVDSINERWGDFVIAPARMIGTAGKVVDRVAFGGVKELEEFTLLR